VRQESLGACGRHARVVPRHAFEQPRRRLTRSLERRLPARAGALERRVLSRPGAPERLRSAERRVR
jgi:hypothetical protein